MSAAATPFRSLVFRGTVPLQVQLEPQDLPLTADRSVEYYYLQVPRVSYLALCLDDIKRNLVQLVLDHASFAALKDDDLWFETLPADHQAPEGTPLRWHWPIGLLYDLHATSRHLGLLPPRPVTIPPSFASVFAPFDDEDGSQGQDAGAGGNRSQELPELLSLSIGRGATARRGSNTNTLASSSSTTLRGGGGGGPSTSSGAVASSSRLRTPSAPPRQQGGGAPPSSSSSTSMNRARSAAAAVPASSSSSPSSPSASTSISFPPPSSAVSSPTMGGGNEVTMATRPWRIRLRIRNLKGANGGGASTSSSSSSSRAAAAAAAAAEAVGVLDAGAEGAGGGRNRVEEIRTGFMALVKEADYVRWGSTKRVMNLRKELQDNLWEAVVENDFEKYWNVASKLVPLPAPPAVGSKKPTRTTPPSASSSAGEGGRSFSSSQEPDANGIKHVPLRVYLPAPPPSGGGASNGAGVATVVQEPVAPTRRDGSPTTLRQALSQLVPLLFAPLPSSSSSSSSPAAPPPPPPPLAYPLIHGIYPPFETEVGWLGACMAGPDGWVNVVVVLDERGQPDVSGPGASSSL